ncbi:uncharacterized protein B0I36DRAFT_411895 [Microdochium trichocladiopsis]|uniref:Uncharacterized protein n=1 Tax=Microdochium trichocladiopsis TaxID=1682393 RepID=A0A9P9BPW8_9PEZI|nr:uncharacterized protein B0I36DRAFT_411895 [Microdochium trichocladiopsis]KAH7029709.1 hypothetical protein B0I36DRAFT_411895 [Microdochium trichocladiopsis]
MKYSIQFYSECQQRLLEIETDDKIIWEMLWYLARKSTLKFSTITTAEISSSLVSGKMAKPSTRYTSSDEKAAGSDLLNDRIVLNEQVVPDEMLQHAEHIDIDVYEQGNGTIHDFSRLEQVGISGDEKLVRVASVDNYRPTSTNRLLAYDKVQISLYCAAGRPLQPLGEDIASVAW